MPYRRAGVLLVEHRDGQIDQGLLCTAKLALPQAPPIPQSANHDLQELLPLPDLLNPVPYGIADVERLHAPLVELGQQALRGWRSRDISPVVEEDDPELLLAAEEGVEELLNPGEGEQVVCRGGGELEEAVGDLPLEDLELELQGGGVTLVGLHGVGDGGGGGGGLVAAEAEDGAADVGALVIRRVHSLTWKVSKTASNRIECDPTKEKQRCRNELRPRNQVGSSEVRAKCRA